MHSEPGNVHSTWRARLGQGADQDLLNKPCSLQALVPARAKLRGIAMRKLLSVVSLGCVVLTGAGLGGAVDVPACRVRRREPVRTARRRPSYPDTASATSP